MNNNSTYFHSYGTSYSHIIEIFFSTEEKDGYTKIDKFGRAVRFFSFINLSQIMHMEMMRIMGAEACHDDVPVYYKILYTTRDHSGSGLNCKPPVTVEIDLKRASDEINRGYYTISIDYLIDFYVKRIQKEKEEKNG